VPVSLWGGGHRGFSGHAGTGTYDRFVRIAAVQLTSGPDRHENLRVADDLVSQAAEEDAELVVLPELFSALGDRATFLANAEPLHGPTLAWAAERAVDGGIWLVAGSFVEDLGDGRLANTSCLVAPTGELAAAYRKVHLFDVTVPGAELQESATFTAGTDLVTADVTTRTGEDITLGLSTCYDIRFPELYRILTLRGARILVVPAAFTAATGPAHWEVLLRARAIENQCYVVAAGQTGETDARRRWHGHSMIVDPWGRVLADAGTEPGIIAVDADLGELEHVRALLPSLANRRPDTYRWPATDDPTDPAPVAHPEGRPAP